MCEAGEREMKKSLDSIRPCLSKKYESTRTDGSPIHISFSWTLGSFPTPARTPLTQNRSLRSARDRM